MHKLMFGLDGPLEVELMYRIKGATISNGVIKCFLMDIFFEIARSPSHSLWLMNIFFESVWSLLQAWSMISKLTEEKTSAMQQNQKLRQELVGSDIFMLNMFIFSI